MTPLTILGLALTAIAYVMALFINVASMKLREALALPYGWLSLGLFVAGIALLVWA